MSKIYYKAMIEDMTSDQCSDREIECLLDHYQAVVKQVGLARTAFYDLADFPLAIKYKVDKFKLKIDRKMVLDQEQFSGVFTSGDKKLTVIATLEKH